jgi:hypothetical protein
MLALTGALAWEAAGAFAHDNFRVIGTIEKRRDDGIDVKDKNGKITFVKIDKQTAVTKDKKKVELALAKVGQSVVVDAVGDSEADLLAVEIRIVPRIADVKK